MSGVTVLRRADGSRYALFASPYWLDRVEHEQPELTLDRMLAEGLIVPAQAPGRETAVLIDRVPSRS
jgi:hypothetical protein